MAIKRGNIQIVRRQIESQLADKLDSADQRTSTAVSGATAPALADIKHDTTFYNSTGSTQTITLPATIAADQVGKRFHFVASATFGGALTVTCSSTGLLRDKANGSAPHTVTNGTLTITVAQGSSSLRFYSVGGDFA